MRASPAGQQLLGGGDPAVPSALDAPADQPVAAQREALLAIDDRHVTRFALGSERVAPTVTFEVYDSR